MVETVGGVETEIGSRLIGAQGVHQVYYLPTEGTNVQLRVVRGIGPGSGRIDLGPIKIKRLVYTPQDVTLVVCNSVEDRYRFGFNGQMKDNELKGIGNSLDFKYRMEDTRLARFFAVDPLASKYPWYSPYQFAGNTPIMAMELEGLEPVVKTGKQAVDEIGYNNEPPPAVSTEDGLSAGELFDKGRLDLASLSGLKALRNMGAKSWAKITGQKTYERRIYVQEEDGSFWQKTINAPTEGASSEQIVNDLDALSLAPGGGGTPSFMAKNAPVQPSTVVNTVTSVVKKDARVLKAAEETFQGNNQLRKEANNMIDQVRRGNLNPGIGTKEVGNGIFELRSRGGARIYFQVVGQSKIQIVGYSNKSNQQSVINLLMDLYKAGK